MRALFFFGTDPCKKRKIAKAEPVAQNIYADTSKVLPDSDPTNKKSENRRRHPRCGCGGGGTSRSELQDKLKGYSIWF